MAGNADLLAGLSRHATLAGLRRSEFFARHAARLESVLTTPEVAVCASSSPRLSAFVRVAQWNIEKGMRFEAVVHTFERYEALRWADVILLNEVDWGMNRSGNRHVARCLAQALGMNMVFAPACLELTKGVGEELALEGENRESLQGNALLTRYPVLDARVVVLPQCFEPFEFHEKRYGGRNCLWVRLQTGRAAWWIGATHLEVRNTPACRAAQMRRLLEGLPAGAGEPCLLAGDLNTNGFPRGSRRRTFSTAARLILSRPGTMKNRLLHPERVEPLFRAAAGAGFSFQDFNSFEATACAPLESIEDAGMVPAFLRGFLMKRLVSYRDGLCMKLDWFLGRNMRALRAGEVVDPGPGVASSNPRCVQTLRTGPERVSDHSPIFADVRLPE